MNPIIQPEINKGNGAKERIAAARNVFRMSLSALIRYREDGDIVLKPNISNSYCGSIDIIVFIP